LRSRLPDYDPRRHLGGAVYLFVRAVRPAWSGAGVFFHPAPVDAIEELSDLLGEVETVDA
jgi:exodeoxyribonuclease V beta subunit